MLFSEAGYDADISSTNYTPSVEATGENQQEGGSFDATPAESIDAVSSNAGSMEITPATSSADSTDQTSNEHQQIIVKSENMDTGMNIDVPVPSEFSHPEQNAPQPTSPPVNKHARAKSVRDMLNRMLGRDKHPDEIVDYEDMEVDQPEPQSTGMTFPARKDPTMTFPVRPQPYFPQPQRMVEKSEIRSFGPQQHAWNPNPYRPYQHPDYHGYGNGYFQVKQEVYRPYGGVGKRGRKPRKYKPKKSQKVDPSLPHKKSKYKGVYWERRDQKWRARTYVHGKRYSGGSYVNERECALAVNRLCEVMGVPPLNPELEGLSLGDSTRYSGFEFKGRPYRPRNSGSIRVKQENQYFPSYSYGGSYGGFPQDELAF